MKRIIIFAMMVSCVITLVIAQDFPNRDSRRRQQPQSCCQCGSPWNQRREPQRPPQRGQGQGMSNWWEDFSRQLPQSQSTSVSGNLVIVQGMIAVQSGDVTYLAGGLQRFVGFIDGLKEGAAVTLEGNAFGVPNNDKVKFLHVQKLTLGGKDYDIAPQRRR